MVIKETYQIWFQGITNSAMTLTVRDIDEKCFDKHEWPSVHDQNEGFSYTVPI